MARRWRVRRAVQISRIIIEMDNAPVGESRYHNAMTNRAKCSLMDAQELLCQVAEVSVPEVMGLATEMIEFAEESPEA